MSHASSSSPLSRGGSSSIASSWTALGALPALTAGAGAGAGAGCGSSA